MGISIKEARITGRGSEREPMGIEPGEIDVDIYEKWYNVYRRLYPALKEPMSVSFDILHQKG